MALDVKIIDAQLEAALEAMRRIEGSLGSMKDIDRGLADACGHDELAEAIKSFSDSWRIKRDELTAMTRAHRLSIQAARDWSDRIDDLVPPDGPQEPPGDMKPANQGLDVRNEDHSPPGTGPVSDYRSEPDPRSAPSSARSEITGGAGKPGLSPTGAVEGRAQNHIDSTGGPINMRPVPVGEPAQANPDVGDVKVEEILEGADDPVARRVKDVLGDLVDLAFDDAAAPEAAAALGGMSAAAALAVLALTPAQKKGAAGGAAPRAMEAVSNLRQTLDVKPAGDGDPTIAGRPGRIRNRILSSLLGGSAAGSAAGESRHGADSGPVAEDARIDARTAIAGLRSSAGAAGATVDAGAPVPASAAGQTAPGAQQAIGAAPPGDSTPNAGGPIGGSAASPHDPLVGTGGEGLTGSSGILPPGEASAPAPEETDAHGANAAQTGASPHPDSAADHGLPTMLGGMGMAAGLGAQPATSHEDEQRREKEARKLRDRLKTAKTEKKEHS